MKKNVNLEKIEVPKKKYLDNVDSNLNMMGVFGELTGFAVFCWLVLFRRRKISQH